MLTNNKNNGTFTIENTRLSNSQQLSSVITHDNSIYNDDISISAILGGTSPNDSSLGERSLPTYSSGDNHIMDDVGDDIERMVQQEPSKKIVAKAKKRFLRLRGIIDDYVKNQNYREEDSIIRDYLDNQDNEKNSLDPSRAILGDMLPLGEYPMGVDSFPGPDITYTPPLQTSPMVSLGCLNSQVVTDIVPIVKLWPNGQTPENFATGSSRQPGTLNVSGSSNNGGVFNSFTQTNSLNNGHNTTFNSSVYLTSDVSLYGLSHGAAATGYSPITLSQEGLLWTLWPLSKEINYTNPNITYFDDITFGTSKYSNYQLGQMGYFINNKIMGCTPLGSVNPNSGIIPSNTNTFPMTKNTKSNSPGVLSGIESLNQALLTVTKQQLAVVVVKVTEQIARIENPESGMASDNEFIFVGYDGWAVIHSTNNPIGPMAMQTYISPQTTTGNIVDNNYQVVLPPNFPSVIYYKNSSYKPPISSEVGLFAGTPL